MSLRREAAMGMHNEMNDPTGQTASKRGKAFALLGEGKVQPARMWLEQVCEENPEDHAAWLALGLCHRQLGSREKAIACLKRAVDTDPEDATAHSKLGLAYLDCLAVRQALAHFRQATAIAPRDEEANIGLGSSLLAEGRYAELADHCRQALAHVPRSAELHCQLAVALERAHNLEEARDAAEAAVLLQPGHQRACFLLAQLDRRSGHFQQARRRLQGLLLSALAPHQRAAVAAELGRTLDQVGEYAAAFQAFEAGNRALVTTVSTERYRQLGILAEIERNRQWFTDESTAAWQAEEPDDDCPAPIFLVGFPRSGTTLTEQVLASVDHIRASDEKTMLTQLRNDIAGILGRPVFYPKGLNELTTSDLSRLRSHYWHLVDEMVGPLVERQQLLDKLPLNLVDLGLVYRIFPRARVIVVLRDPRDACLSCFMQSLLLNQAMVNFLELERTARLYAATMKLWLHYRSFLKLPFLELRYEDLVADLPGQARRLLEFVGLEWDEEVLRFFHHARERDITTPSYSAVASGIYDHAVGRWHNYEKQLVPVKEILAPFVEAFGYK
jgi:tetratricopeptide (TPR) repeat protein